MSGDFASLTKTGTVGLPNPRPGVESSHLLNRLLESPWEFDFFQAVFLLKRFQEDVFDPGFLGPFSRESVHFCASTSLAFPASQIQNIQLGNQPNPGDSFGDASPVPPLMEINFLGLQGPSGILPNFYTQLIQQLDRNKENHERRSFQAWLDLFNHRLTSIFFRTWAKYRPPIIFDSDFARRPGGFDRFTETNLALIGIGLLVLRDQIGRLGEHTFAGEQPFPGEKTAPDKGLESQDVLADDSDKQRAGSPPFYPFEDRFLIIHGSAFSRSVRTAVGLEALLSDYLKFPVEVEQFRPRWLPLENNCQTQLSHPGPDGEKDPQTGRLYGGLGTGALCGSRVLEMQSHFRLRIGPLDEPTLNQFLPAVSRGGKAIPSPLLRTVRELTRVYVRNGMDFEIQLVVRGEALPPPVLDKDRPVLGQSLWLFGKKPEHPVDELVFFSEMSV